MRVVGFGALFGSLSLLACAPFEHNDDLGDGDAVSTVSQPIYGGSSTGTQYPFVVGLGIYDSYYGLVGQCSGTLIAPNLVLTARHCVSQTNTESVNCAVSRFTADYPLQSLRVTTEPRMPSEASSSALRTVREIIHPSENAMCGADISLLVLDQNIPGNVAVPAVPLIHNSLNDRGQPLRLVTAIGYGSTDGYGNGSGTRRIRQNVQLVCSYGHPTRNYNCSQRFGSQLSGVLDEADLLVGEGVCGGDSGSSAFAQSAFSAEKYYSVGVLSRGSQDDCDMAVYTRVDAHKELIIRAARRAASLGGYAVPSWIEPSADDEWSPSVAPAEEPPPKEETPEPPQKAGFEEPCEYSDDCASGVCIDYNDAAICTVFCRVQECPSGYQCVSGEYCVPSTRPTDVELELEDGASQGGCAMADPNRPIPWRSGAPLVLALSALVWLRRRMH